MILCQAFGTSFLRINRFPFALIWSFSFLHLFLFESFFIFSSFFRHPFSDYFMDRPGWMDSVLVLPGPTVKFH